MENETKGLKIIDLVRAKKIGPPPRSQYYVACPECGGELFGEVNYMHVNYTGPLGRANVRTPVVEKIPQLFQCLSCGTIMNQADAKRNVVDQIVKTRGPQGL